MIVEVNKFSLQGFEFLISEGIVSEFNWKISRVRGDGHQQVGLGTLTESEEGLAPDQSPCVEECIQHIYNYLFIIILQLKN